MHFHYFIKSNLDLIILNKEINKEIVGKDL